MGNSVYGKPNHLGSIMQSITLLGPQINFYVNNQIYKVAQTVSLEIEYNEEGIYGIDTPYPQEIAGGRTMVRGSVKGVRIRNSGGLQAFNIRPTFSNQAASPYISIRVQDRTTNEDIFLITNAKVTRESHEMMTRGVYRLSFDFVGQIPLMALDRVT
jgi:hypothetical protein